MTLEDCRKRAALISDADRFVSVPLSFHAIGVETVEISLGRYQQWSIEGPWKRWGHACEREENCVKKGSSVRLMRLMRVVRGEP